MLVALRALLVSMLLAVTLGGAAAADGRPPAPTKLWVFFADKGHPDAAAESAAVARLARDFPARAAARRAQRRSLPGLVDARDLPVAPAYVERLAALGLKVHASSRWLNAVSVTADARQRAQLESLPFVLRTQPVGRTVRPTPAFTPVGKTAAGAAAGPADGSFYGFAENQIELIDLDALHALGHTGEGVVIGVLDSGFRTTHEAFHQPGHALQIVAAHDFVDDDAEVGPQPGDHPDQHFHGTFVLGELAAYQPGVLVGAAYDAAYILCKTEDIEVESPAEEDLYVAGLEFIELHGGDVATSSLGYIDWYDQDDLDGQTAVTTQAVNIATANGLHCCTAAGNTGNDHDPDLSHLIAPADAFQVLTCGAVEPGGGIADFSSDGPTADQRVKPEVMAMGTEVISLWPFDDVQFAEAAGTSMSTPLVAGVVACLAGAHPEWSVPTLRERVIKSASYFGGLLPDPERVYGWGIVDADRALTLAGSWVAVPGGAPGGSGTPVLAGSGPLVGGQSVTLTLSNGKPLASAAMIVGFTQLSVAFKGGVLVPSVNLLVPGLALNGAGVISLSFTWAAGLPAGTQVFLQMWMPDAAGPAGFAASNGLRATTP